MTSYLQWQVQLSLFLCVPLSPTVENTQLILNLQTENKGSVVSGGELTIFLDGPTVDLGSLPNGSAVTEGEYRPSPPAGCSLEREVANARGQGCQAEMAAWRTCQHISKCRSCILFQRRLLSQPACPQDSAQLLGSLPRSPGEGSSRPTMEVRA